MLNGLLNVLNVSISFKLYEVIVILGSSILMIWLLKQYMNGKYPFESED